MNKTEGMTATVLISRILKERLPGRKIYPTLGNHEKVPLDQFDFEHVYKEKDFLKSIGDEWRGWIGEEAYNMFINYGYYTLLHNNSSLRIVSINSFLWDNWNFYLLNNPTNPLNQMDWLENVLRNAEKAGEGVFIIGHIPPGSNYFNSEASLRYNALVDRFTQTIRGQFFGHSHSDEWKLIHGYFDKNNTVGIVHTCGSLSTNAWRNPGFRVYNMYEDNHVVKDYTFLYLNLTKANNLPDNVLPKFEFGYNASSFYNMSHLHEFDKWTSALDRMLVDDQFFQDVQDIFFGYGTPHVYLGPPSPKSSKVDEDIRHFIYCRYNEGIFKTYLQCMNGGKSWEALDGGMSFLEKLSGKWHIRKEFN